jgi:hypothetical protein
VALSSGKLASAMRPTAAGGVRPPVAASTVTLKAAEALPPELLAVTVTLAPATTAAVGMPTLPVAGSMLAPAPETA